MGQTVLHRTAEHGRGVDAAVGLGDDASVDRAGCMVGRGPVVLVGIFPKDTGGLPAAGVHQQGIGVAVRFGTAAQQFSVVLAGRVIARPFAWHGSRLLSASCQHGPRSTLRATAGLFLRGPFRLCLFGRRFSGFELVADGRTPHRAALRHLFQLCLLYTSRCV